MRTSRKYTHINVYKFNVYNIIQYYFNENKKKIIFIWEFFEHFTIIYDLTY